MNDWTWQDFNHEEGIPISYHCIVHEAPLPERHWYRWPNSKSRLLSNGCHWIDHFLYINHFPEVTERSVRRAKGGDLVVTAELANGANFSMVLTDRGSSRIGVEEHVEMRSGGITIRVENNSRYVAEDSRRILRRARVNKHSSYCAMYATISDRINRGLEGDSLESIRHSCGLTISLEEELQRNSEV